MSDKIEIGICWFQPDQWSRLLQIVEDPNELDDSYDEWRKNAHQTIQRFRAQGLSVRKVSVNLEDLLSWCNERGVPVNGKSRSEYVTEVMSKRSNK